MGAETERMIQTSHSAHISLTFGSFAWETAFVTGIGVDLSANYRRVNGNRRQVVTHADDVSARLHVSVHGTDAPVALLEPAGLRHAHRLLAQWTDISCQHAICNNRNTITHCCVNTKQSLLTAR